MKIVQEHICELETMKSYPKELFFSGNLELLKKTKISIVGSRKPSKYSRSLTHQLSAKLSKNGICVVSGGAMGIDAIAHKGAGESNTISVLPCGINIKYPTINKNLLSTIENDGLLLSQFEENFRATPWSFVVRNELVVALGDVLVVAEAELNSGSMRSIEFALKMNKEIYVFAHRIGESSATNELLKTGNAKAIYDIDEFVSKYANHEINASVMIDDFKNYCQTNPTYDDALKKYPNKIFEAELSGEIIIENGRVISSL
ncbi:DNA recombination-mediator protein A [Sulfurimonas gotlandica GD1]|uniref:DNA recombination-mediator protein A n=1 Tax=Sulfurimonas gotlandica (strain DSM 19862 / JCM 16533 / GD1) TaxID=929558 RepID=H1FW06_SULGG|nr:DNA-processing protein DprA [Sulfurimonas gotlandica]EHP30388.1 DNA recombination-mediator protein A [Sulfurimonas gotlandica GD1]